ncbi:MAG: hypothetical protein IPP73_20380 [Chitinophagaceae bacterium]|nr:hypothetical protein [Chitinophagaceae bacterium]
MNFRSSNTAYGMLNNVTSENYAIYGNVSGLPPSYNFVYYDGHHVITSDIEFNTVKY